MCGKCGGELCGDGAVTKAVEAKNTSRKAEELIKSKYRSTSSTLSEARMFSL